MSELAYIPSAAAELLTKKLWALTDPNPTRGTSALFGVAEGLDKSAWLQVPTDFSIPVDNSAELDGIADILQPWVGHGITQEDIALLEKKVVLHRGQHLIVYDAFPEIFKLADAGNPTGLGRTKEQLIAAGILPQPSLP